MTSFLTIVNKNDESDTDFLLAKYFLDHFRDIPGLSIYPHITYADHTDFSNYLKNSVDNMMNDINRMAEQQRLGKLAEVIHDSDRVFIVNAEDSSSAARFFQQQMLSMQKLVRLVTSNSYYSKISVLQTLTERDCMITCSASGNYALTINDTIAGVKAYRALVTLNRTVLFQDCYDYIFYLSETLQPSNRTLLRLRNVYTRYGTAYFFDLLFHQYFAKYQQELRPD